MEQKDALDFEGTATFIREELSQYVVMQGLESVFLTNFILDNKNLLSENEYFVATTENAANAEICNMFVSNKYHLRIMPFTLALICWFMDKYITKGLALILLTLYDVDYSMTKLEGFEKCIAYKLKKEKKLRFEEFIPLSTCTCDPLKDECSYIISYGTCKKWNENEIKSTIESLIQKKIIKKQEGDYYAIII